MNDAERMPRDVLDYVCASTRRHKHMHGVDVYESQEITNERNESEPSKRWHVKVVVHCGADRESMCLLEY